MKGARDMTFDRRMLTLYAVTDSRWLHGQTLAQQVELAIRGGATMVQLREKGAGEAELIALARELAAVCKAHGVPFIVNDSPRIALAADADGVHLGQKDMPPDEARRILGSGKIVGATARTVEQALRAQALGADYIGSGAVFGTGTKADAVPLSREELTAICRAVDIPVVAIGSVNRENILRLAGTGGSGAAVISGIFAQADVDEAARELRELSEQMIGQV